LTSDKALRVWITDTIGWWSALASEPLCRSGHEVMVFSSGDELRTSTANAVAVPDVVVYACAATSSDDLEALAHLASGPWILMVVVGEIDVVTTCALFERGVAAIGGRYDPPAVIVRAIERATRTAHVRRTRQAAWSVPV
jgi:hypothetical protein